MTIKFIRFSRPVHFPSAVGGTDFWSPAKYPNVSVSKRDGGIVLVDGKDNVHVPMTNVDQVTYTEAEPAVTQKQKGAA